MKILPQHENAIAKHSKWGRNVSLADYTTFEAKTGVQLNVMHKTPKTAAT